MNRLQILRSILLLGAGATVVGVAGYRYSKSSAVKASPAPRVVAAVAPGPGLKEAGENGKTINLAATGKGEGVTKAPSTLQAFRDRIMKAKAEPNIPKRMALLSEAIQTLDPSQIREALAEFEMNRDQFRTRLRNMLLSRWGESDPKAALDYAKGLVFESASFGGVYGDGGFEINGLSITPLFDSWFKKDFPAAKAWVEGLPADSWFRKGLLPSLAFDMAQKDPVAALNLARTISSDQAGGDSVRRKSISGAIVGWSLKDTDAALAYVAQLPDDRTKISILESMSIALAPKDPDKAINLIEQIPPKEQNVSLRKFGSAWAQSDPKAALDFANQQTDPEVKSEILKGVISAMSEKDSKGALELAQSLPKDYKRDGTIYTVLEKLSESDPKGAVGYAMNLLSGEKSSLISSMSVDWISNDPQGALAWYGSLTDTKLKEQVAHNMIDYLSRDDVAKSLDLLDKMPPGDVRNQAISTIANNWARTDQKAVLDWANQQTDPEVKSRILAGVIRTMSVKDPNSAFQLAQSLPSGNIRDYSINRSLGSMAQSDPRSAIALASGIADADLRSKAQQNVVEIWKRRDPTAATQWVNSSSLPEDVKTRLLQQK